MKEIALDAIKASIKWVKGYGNLNHAVFEIYGLDYMIDENFKPWLIEINTNPCIETSSILMEKIIPRMVDEAFRLSLDIIFPPPEMWPNSKKHNISSL
jgi:tubulin polyglutamylase TTLL1